MLTRIIFILTVAVPLATAITPGHETVPESTMSWSWFTDFTSGIGSMCSGLLSRWNEKEPADAESMANNMKETQQPRFNPRNDCELGRNLHATWHDDSTKLKRDAADLCERLKLAAANKIKKPRLMMNDFEKWSEKHLPRSNQVRRNSDPTSKSKFSKPAKTGDGLRTRLSEAIHFPERIEEGMGVTEDSEWADLAEETERTVDRWKAEDALTEKAKLEDYVTSKINDEDGREELIHVFWELKHGESNVNVPFYQCSEEFEAKFKQDPARYKEELIQCFKGNEVKLETILRANKYHDSTPETSQGMASVKRSKRVQDEDSGSKADVLFRLPRMS